MMICGDGFGFGDEVWIVRTLLVMMNVRAIVANSRAYDQRMMTSTTPVTLENAKREHQLAHHDDCPQ